MFVPVICYNPDSQTTKFNLLSRVYKRPEGKPLRRNKTVDQNVSVPENVTE